MKTQLSHNEVCDMLTHYAANAISSSDIAEKLNKENDVEVATILGQFQREWDAVECDAEGCTAEQDKELDSILDDYAAQLLAL